MLNLIKIGSWRLTNILSILVVLIGLILGLILSISWWTNQRNRSQSLNQSVVDTVDDGNRDYDKTKILVDDLAEPLEIIEKVKQ